jgi:putative SOS response-associated peptidase YedK
MVQQGLASYLRHLGAEFDLDQIAAVYGMRQEDPAIRIPRGFDRNFDAPATSQAELIKRCIDAYRKAEVTKLETELFGLKKRLADAERKLATKETKAARNDQRIATDKIARTMSRLPLLAGSQPAKSDGRIFPFHYAPIVVAEQGRNLVRLARYHLRQPGKPASIDRQFPGLYNARRDNLEKYWRHEFGHTHAVMLVDSFYENVDRDGHNAVLHFVPRPAELMRIACLAATWVDPAGGTLLSFAAITDEPPPEVRATGHDRMIVNLKPGNVQPWLTPAGRSAPELQALLADRQQAYYEHQILAA